MAQASDRAASGLRTQRAAGLAKLSAALRLHESHAAMPAAQSSMPLITPITETSAPTATAKAPAMTSHCSTNASTAIATTAGVRAVAIRTSNTAMALFRVAPAVSFPPRLVKLAPPVSLIPWWPQPRGGPPSMQKPTIKQPVLKRKGVAARRPSAKLKPAPSPGRQMGLAQLQGFV